MKAILILNETPKCCLDCPCCNLEEFGCDAGEKTIDCRLTGRPESCPLIEINDNIARLIEVAR